MTDAKKDPHPHLPGGTGTGPAGGEPVHPTTPARDPAAEAAALAAFEANEQRLAEVDLPAQPAVAQAEPPPASDEAPAADAGVPAPTAPSVSGGMRMEPLGAPLTAPPVVVFDKVTKTYG